MMKLKGKQCFGYKRKVLGNWLVTEELTTGLPQGKDMGICSLFYQEPGGRETSFGANEVRFVVLLDFNKVRYC